LGEIKSECGLHVSCQGRTYLCKIYWTAMCMHCMFPSSRLIAALRASTAPCKRGFSAMNIAENSKRSASVTYRTMWRENKRFQADSQSSRLPSPYCSPLRSILNSSSNRLVSHRSDKSSSNYRNNFLFPLRVVHTSRS
jgi:hypothetical protein